MKAGLWVAGGLLVGLGFVTMLGDFQGMSGVGVATESGEFLGPASEVYPTTGYDTTEDVRIFGKGWLALALGLSGLALLVYANANAWKDTGGY